MTNLDAHDPHDVTDWPHITAATSLPCPTWCGLPPGHALEVDAHTSTIPGHVVPHEHQRPFSARYWRPAAYGRAHTRAIAVTPQCLVTVEAWESALTPGGPSQTNAPSITVANATYLSPAAATELAGALAEAVGIVASGDTPD